MEIKNILDIEEGYEDWEKSLGECLWDNSLNEDFVDFSNVKEGTILMSISRSLFPYKNGKYIKPQFVDAHRIFIVDKMKHTNQYVCHGYTFTSSTRNSNNNPDASEHDKQAHIYIDDFNNIFDPPGNYEPHSCYIDLDSIVEIKTDKHRFQTKGVASKQFIEFVRKCRDNLIHGRDNSHLMWIDGKEYIEEEFDW